MSRIIDFLIFERPWIGLITFAVLVIVILFGINALALSSSEALPPSQSLTTADGTKVGVQVTTLYYGNMPCLFVTNAGTRSTGALSCDWTKYREGE